MSIFTKKFPFYKQLDIMDCGATCLKIIAKYYGKEVSIQQLRQKSYLTKQGASLLGIANAAEEIGLRTLPLNIDFTTLKNDIPLPFIAHWRQRHYIVVYKITPTKIYLADPAFGRIKISKDKFLEGWLYNKTLNLNQKNHGHILVVEPTTEFYIKENNKQKKYNLSLLKPYIKRYKNQLKQVFLSLLLTTFITSLLPYFTQQLVDKGVTQKNVTFVIVLIIGQFIFYFSQVLLDVVRRWYLLVITRKVRIMVISDLLKRMMSLPVSFFNSKTQGDLIQRIDDQIYLENFLANAFLNAFFALINVSVFGGIMLYYNWKFFITYLIGIILYVLWVQFFVKERARLSYLRRDLAHINRNSILQILNGILDIKLNNSNVKRRREWESIQSRTLDTSQKELRTEQIQIIGGNMVMQITYLFITALSAIAVIQGTASLGTMLALQFILGQLTVPINSFVVLFQDYKEARISLDRMGELFEEKTETTENTFSENALQKINDIHIQDVSFKYNHLSQNYILKNINLFIPAGKITAIVGTSGSGKTSLINLLLKFYEQQQGDIFYGTTNLKNISEVSWRKKCGAVLQDGFIFPDTILRNISESDQDYTIDKERLKYATKMANIQDTINNLPLGYQTNLKFSGINLSGGENQRILIARCIYKNPDIILFDEATSALDAHNEKIIMNNLNFFFKGKTVIIVAHRLSTVKNADNVVVFEKGEIIEQGTHPELIQRKGTYFNLVKNQLELNL